MLDIHALQVFYEAAHARSFTAAARKLNMTQPAVSMQIKTLEDNLQVKLFERNGRTMQLTKAGQALIPRARQIIDLTLRTEEFIRMSNDEVLGDLVIGCSLPSTSEVLIHIAARFQQMFPHVRVRIPSVSNEELIDKVAVGLYDFGIMNVVQRCDVVECLPLFNDEIVLIAPNWHRFIRERSIAPIDLVDERFVCQGEFSACRTAVHQAFKPFGVDTLQFDVRMEIGNHAAIVSAVEHGIGLAFVSRIEATAALSRGSIRIVPIDNVTLTTSVGLAYSTTHLPSLAAMKFRAYIANPRTQSDILQIIELLYHSPALEQENYA